MKKANKQFRRAMLAAEREKKENVKKYPLDNRGSAEDTDSIEDESVTLYSDSSISIMCSANLLGSDKSLI